MKDDGLTTDYRMNDYGNTDYPTLLHQECGSSEFNGI
jgi:hypothetical protein